jgi:hypothetical protein
MVEYTRELLNSNCHIGWIITLVSRTITLIESRILKDYATIKGKTKMIYNLTTERDIRYISIEIMKNNKKKYDIELSWKIAMDMIVRELKKVFIDSNIYYNNKEILDISDEINIHRLIIVDWG